MKFALVMKYSDFRRLVTAPETLPTAVLRAVHDPAHDAEIAGCRSPLVLALGQVAQLGLDYGMFWRKVGLPADWPARVQEVVQAAADRLPQ